MASEGKDKSKDKDKDKDKSKKPADNKAKAAPPKDAKPKKEKEKDKAVAEVEAPKPKAPPPPRPPADPRLKVMKKFKGRFLPKGPLRDRYRVILARWNSGEDHGGVTVDELKTLLADWRASREKPVKVKA
jgi:hypothetical protein